jgi:hypothetical protein
MADMPGNRPMETGRHHLPFECQTARPLPVVTITDIRASTSISPYHDISYQSRSSRPAFDDDCSDTLSAYGDFCRYALCVTPVPGLMQTCRPVVCSRKIDWSRIPRATSRRRILLDSSLHHSTIRSPRYIRYGYPVVGSR